MRFVKPVLIVLLCLSRVCIVGGGVLGGATATAAPPPQDMPLSVEKIEALIKVAPDETVAGEIQDKGLSFTDEDATLVKRLIGKAGPRTASAIRDAFKIKISLFDYVKCGQYKEDFQVFTLKMTSYFNGLVIDLRKLGAQYEYLSNVSIIKENKPFELNPQQMDRYWKRSTVQILSGACEEKDGSVFVYSDIYLGPYRGSIAEEPINIGFKVQAKNYGPMKNALTALLLYALANEAKVKSRKPQLTNVYLTSARNKVAEVVDPGQTAEVKPIKDAIDTMLQELNLPAPPGIAFGGKRRR